MARAGEESDARNKAMESADEFVVAIGNRYRRPGRTEVCVTHNGRVVISTFLRSETTRDSANVDPDHAQRIIAAAAQAFLEVEATRERISSDDDEPTVTFELRGGGATIAAIARPQRWFDLRPTARCVLRAVGEICGDSFETGRHRPPLSPPDSSRGRGPSP